MPYITFSRNVEDGKSALKECRAIAAMFERSAVVLRGKKSVRALVRDAKLKGFRSVVLVRDQKIEILSAVPQRGAIAYKWGKEYSLKSVRGKPAISRGGKDAKKEFVRYAGD